MYILSLLVSTRAAVFVLNRREYIIISGIGGDARRERFFLFALALGQVFSVGSMSQVIVASSLFDNNFGIVDSSHYLISIFC